MLVDGITDCVLYLEIELLALVSFLLQGLHKY